MKRHLFLSAVLALAFISVAFFATSHTASADTGSTKLYFPVVERTYDANIWTVCSDPLGMMPIPGKAPDRMTYWLCGPSGEIVLVYCDDPGTPNVARGTKYRREVDSEGIVFKVVGGDWSQKLRPVPLPATSTAVSTATNTPVPTATATGSATDVATIAPPTLFPWDTPTATPTGTQPATATPEPTSTPTGTLPTAEPSSTPDLTATPTETPVLTATPTATATDYGYPPPATTATPVETATPTGTLPTAEPSSTPDLTATAEPTATGTLPTATATVTGTLPATASPSPSPTADAEGCREVPTDLNALPRLRVDDAQLGQWFHPVYDSELFASSGGYQGQWSWFHTICLLEEVGGEFLGFENNDAHFVTRVNSTSATFAFATLQTSVWGGQDLRKQFLGEKSDYDHGLNLRLAPFQTVDVIDRDGAVLATTQPTSGWGDILVTLPDDGIVALRFQINDPAASASGHLWYGADNRTSSNINRFDARPYVWR